MAGQDDTDARLARVERRLSRLETSMLALKKLAGELGDIRDRLGSVTGSPLTH